MLSDSVDMQGGRSTAKAGSLHRATLLPGLHQPAVTRQICRPPASGHIAPRTAPTHRGSAYMQVAGPANRVGGQHRATWPHGPPSRQAARSAVKVGGLQGSRVHRPVRIHQGHLPTDTDPSLTYRTAHPSAGCPLRKQGRWPAMSTLVPWGPPLAPWVGARNFNALQWGNGTTMLHSGGTALQWGHSTSMPHTGDKTLRCPTVGARHFNAPHGGHGTSMPHNWGTALQCPTVGAWHSNTPCAQRGHGTTISHNGGAALQCSTWPTDPRRPTADPCQPTYVPLPACLLVPDHHLAAAISWTTPV